MPTIRLGLLTLPLAGLLLTWAAIATSAFFDFTGARLAPGEVARAFTSTGYFLSQFVGYVVGLTLLTVGVFALTLYLSEFRRERWTLLAMILSVLGIGLLLSYYGLSTYAVPVLGKAYLNDVQNAVVLDNTIL
jgi:drug/metabolite transporter (DMT)-like permease